MERRCFAKIIQKHRKGFILKRKPARRNNTDEEGEPNQGGDCSHLDLSKMDCYEMENTFIHESLPVQEDVKRQLVRITLPADAEELV